MAGRSEDLHLMQNHAVGSDLRHKIKPANPCKGCCYYGGKAETVKCCNYYLITGVRRPCDAGNACTVRKDGTQDKRKPVRLKNIG